MCPSNHLRTHSNKMSAETIYTSYQQDSAERYAACRAKRLKAAALGENQWKRTTFENKYLSTDVSTSVDKYRKGPRLRTHVLDTEK